MNQLRSYIGNMSTIFREKNHTPGIPSLPFLGSSFGATWSLHRPMDLVFFSHIGFGYKQLFLEGDFLHWSPDLGFSGSHPKAALIRSAKTPGCLFIGGCYNFRALVKAHLKSYSYSNHNVYPISFFFYPNKKWISFQFSKSMLEAKAFWLFTLVFSLRQKPSVCAVRVFDLLPSLFSRGHSRPLRIRPMGAPGAPSGIPRVHPHHRGPGERVRRSGCLADRRRTRGKAEGPWGPRNDCLRCVYVHRVYPP